MNGEELLRIVDAIHREKDIDKEVLFESIETALATAVRKKHGVADELVVRIDRFSGELEAFVGDEPAEVGDLGRIAAQTAKQVIIQRIRDAEQDVILRDYHPKVGVIVNGTVQRIEGGNIIVNLGKAEGIVPRSEKVRGENYNPGERIKAVIHEVRRVGPKVRIVLSRAAPALVERLFELEVPEIGDGVIEIKRVAREPGFRTKIAVSSFDTRVDCIGACVGIRGTRIKAITDELNGEKIDIIRWNESVEALIVNALKPAEIETIHLDEPNKQAMVIVPDDQLSLGIGRKGQNVRLASKLVEWEIKISSESQAAQEPANFTSRELTEDDKKLMAGAAALGLSLSDLRSGGGGGAKKPPADAGALAPKSEAPAADVPSAEGAPDASLPSSEAAVIGTGESSEESASSSSDSASVQPDSSESASSESASSESASSDPAAPSDPAGSDPGIEATSSEEAPTDSVGETPAEDSKTTDDVTPEDPSDSAQGADQDASIDETKLG